MMMNHLKLLAGTLTAAMLMVSATSAATFVAPVWNVGDPGTTSQSWIGMGPALPITTNLTHSSNPAVSPPVLTHVGSFVASSGGLYAFSANYSVNAAISNIGGPGAGTTVLVQTGASLNPDYDPEEDGTGGSAIRDSFQVLDSEETVLSSAILGEVVRTLYDPLFPSSFGDVEYEELAWEIFLPGYTGDFSISFDMMVHSSLQALRIDSAITPVPEPATMLLVGLGAVGLCLHQLRRRK